MVNIGGANPVGVLGMKGREFIKKIKFSSVINYFLNSSFKKLIFYIERN